MSYIYKISNDINNLVYIGQTTGSIQARFKQHLYDSKKHINDTHKFYNAIRTIGADHFKIEIIEECDNDKLDEQERYWINYYDSYNNGYNSKNGGQNSQIKVNPDYCIQYYLNNKNQKTLTQITQELGVGTNMLRELLQEKGIRKKQEYILYKNWTEEEKDKIKNDIKNGCTLDYLVKTYHHDLKIIKKFIEENNLEIISIKNNNKIPILQLDLNGNIIKEWNSIYAARNFYNNRHIGECINGKRKTAAGYKWIKKN